MLHFDLNISLTVKDIPFLGRFDTAARLGFGAVEFFWPQGEDVAAVAQRVRDAGVKVALFNFWAGSLPQGDRGFANHPERQRELRENVPVALELAQRVGCTRLNLLAGKWLPDESRDAQLERVRENVRWVAEQARGAGVTVLLESLNSWENGPFIFTTTHETLAFIDSVGAPNLGYQFDIYHMQRMEGNIVATLRQHIGRIGHIQVADSPNRHQPGTGELNYPYIFQAIAQTDYSGSIGLEYNPDGSLEDSLAWLPPDRRAPSRPEDLRL